MTPPLQTHRLPSEANKWMSVSPRRWSLFVVPLNIWKSSLSPFQLLFSLAVSSLGYSNILNTLQWLTFHSISTTSCTYVHYSSQPTKKQSTGIAPIDISDIIWVSFRVLCKWHLHCFFCLQVGCCYYGLMMHQFIKVGTREKCNRNWVTVVFQTNSDLELLFNLITVKKGYVTKIL